MFSFWSKWIFRSDNVKLIIPDGNSIIRREETLSANKVFTTSTSHLLMLPKNELYVISSQTEFWSLSSKLEA